jgi:signal transduction histidine kinase
MLKNNLFIKICLSFWLATLFMIGAVATIDWWSDTGPFHSRHLPSAQGHPLFIQGQAAVWVFDHEGASSLRDYLDYLLESIGIHAWLFDQNGVELTERPVAAGAADLAASALKSGAAAFTPSRDGEMAAMKIVGSDEKSYAMVAEIHHLSHPPGYEQPPYMMVLRLFAVLAVSGMVCYLLARYLTAPIIGLGAAVRRFTSGDLSVRVGPGLGSRNDEISRLAHDFDRMAERIELLLTSQRVLLRDISHELRSPLARLNVALELCRKHSDQENGKALDRIEREACKLNELIEQLLTLNRVESGLSGMEKTRIDLAGLIQEISYDADFEARSLHRRVEVLSLDVCCIEGNEELLRRAIENVARNAVHYTGEGNAVDVSLHRIDGNGCPQCVITIRDHGDGVPAESIPHLFEPFYRVGISRERDTGGAGLGLAITEAAVRFHSGTVRAENSPNGGLIIEIMIPAL